jgi:hypothetical protein
VPDFRRVPHSDVPELVAEDVVPHVDPLAKQQPVGKRKPVGKQQAERKPAAKKG